MFVRVVERNGRYIVVKGVFFREYFYESGDDSYWYRSIDNATTYSLADDAVAAYKRAKARVRINFVRFV